MLCTFLFAGAFLFPPQVSLPSGGKVSLVGKGPPVVFSSGLFGTMPRHIYTNFVRSLGENMTVVVPDTRGPVTPATITEIVDALAVDSIGFLAHSSFDPDVITQTSCIHGIVLCDPVVFPQLSVGVGNMALAPADISSTPPVLVLRASLAYEGAASNARGAVFPSYLTPRFSGGFVTEEDFDGVGHADLLDDTWAEFARTFFPWMRGITPNFTEFGTWQFDQTAVPRKRDAYRARVANLSAKWLLRGEGTRLEGTVSV